jgi:hypothetical protein
LTNANNINQTKGDPAKNNETVDNIQNIAASPDRGKSPPV